MDSEQAEKALASLAEKGLLEKQGDGSYKPTELGRLIAGANGGAIGAHQN